MMDLRRLKGIGMANDNVGNQTTALALALIGSFAVDRWWAAVFREFRRVALLRDFWHGRYEDRFTSAVISLISI